MEGPAELTKAFHAVLQPGMECNHQKVQNRTNHFYTSDKYSGKSCRYNEPHVKDLNNIQLLQTYTHDSLRSTIPGFPQMTLINLPHVDCK